MKVTALIRDQPSNEHLVSAKMFQLTEWVYKFLASQPIRPNGGDVDTVYGKCLDWYAGFFALLKTETEAKASPLVLYMQ